VSDIQAFGFRNGGADTVFYDGVRIRVFPHDIEHDPITIAACVLTDRAGLGAVGTPEGYWSNTWSQRTFAKRLAAAVEAERQVYKTYRAGRIEESVWKEKFRLFWKVMIRCRSVLGSVSAGCLREVGAVEELDIDLDKLLGGDGSS
jgi:hypothetical protein